MRTSMDLSGVRAGAPGKAKTARFASVLILLAVFGLVGTAGCAVRNPAATLPADDPEAITRTVIESADVALVTATTFYQDQQGICVAANFTNPPNATVRCRFGDAAALDGYRKKVEIANGLFTIAAASVATWKRSPTPENLAAMVTARESLAQRVKEVKP